MRGNPEISYLFKDNNNSPSHWRINLIQILVEDIFFCTESLLSQTYHHDYYCRWYQTMDCVVLFYIKKKKFLHKYKSGYWFLINLFKLFQFFQFLLIFLFFFIVLIFSFFYFFFCCHPFFFLSLNPHSFLSYFSSSFSFLFPLFFHSFIRSFLPFFHFPFPCLLIFPSFLFLPFLSSLSFLLSSSLFFLLSSSFLIISLLSSFQHYFHYRHTFSFLLFPTSYF